MSYLSIQNNNYNTSYLLTGNNSNLHMPENNCLDGSRTEAGLDNNNQANGNDRKLQELWSNLSFETNNIAMEQLKYDKMSWANSSDRVVVDALGKEERAVEELVVERHERSIEEETKTAEMSTIEKDDSPSHHARRPMNAFLIFCKKHRPVVRQKYPNLENRGVTKILGEWWALLDEPEKQPYTDLAKEYKDAFLNANPDFKWYKLPAPPLRTLATRPLQQKTPMPHSSPSGAESVTFSSPPFTSEFTPGKLADESQLGSLTSLMNNNFATSKDNDCCKPAINVESNNNESVGYENANVSPECSIRAQTPPKPIKKRLASESFNLGLVKRNLLENEDPVHGDDYTNQDLVNQVVDNCFVKQEDDETGLNGLRKSDRSCKGKRYEQFMVENKLLGNKKDTKLTQQRFKIENKIEMDASQTNETPKLDLNNTIKRLAERTNIKLDVNTLPEEPKRERTVSETSDADRTPTNDFNLNLRISKLPSLSYDTFVTRKRESKKRKNRFRNGSESKSKMQKVHKEQLIGSKKRKNKSSITHLNNVDSKPNNDLSGLTTLAEVAAITEKM